MSKPEVSTPSKLQVSGTWRAIRSMAVPANVTSLHSGESPSGQLPGIKQINSVAGVPVRLEKPNSSDYFEGGNPSFSKS